MEGNVEFLKQFVLENADARKDISNKINEVISRIKDVPDSDKVIMDDGTVYTKVNTRVQIFREVFGAFARITTDTVYHKEQKAIVKAIVEINVLGKWEEFATGISEQHLDRYNAFACIETAETSAIGRALACMGISGGEYASSNEIISSQQTNKESKPKEKEAAKTQSKSSKSAGTTIKAKASAPKKSGDDEKDSKKSASASGAKKITKASVKSISKKLAMNPEYDEDDLLEIYNLKEIAEMTKDQYEDLKKRLDDEDGFEVTLYDVKKALDGSGYPLDRFFGDQNISSFEELPKSKYESCFILLKNRKKVAPPSTSKSSSDSEEKKEEFVL